jgi:type VI secretion system secreted protein VgrG
MSIQPQWPITLKTPLGDDVLLVDSFTIAEGVSQLFEIRLDAVSEQPKKVIFEKILGQPVTLGLKLAGNSIRYWNGIVSRIVQGDRNSETVLYTIDIVPKLWLLTRVTRSRIFQQKTAPDIIKEVLTGLDISLSVQGTFQPRDYCTQYRESDFQFVSRLMEEEGVYYFFQHGDGTHKMVISNTPSGHPDIPGAASVIYDEVRGGNRPEERIYSWKKSQEVRSGKVTLWDHCFEMPDQHLDADKSAQDSVQVGNDTMKLKLAVSSNLELYDYPGGYAQRFDGVTPGGGDSASNLQHIFEDNKRTVEIRMQADTAQEMRFSAESNVRNIAAGYKFELIRHFSDSTPGKAYVVLTAHHSGSHPLGTERNPESFQYSNQFSSIPVDIPFRPPRTTPIPTVKGSQTAVVVGPSGEEIFTDKYSRVKVQFHWDRAGQKNANSSCWLRVATPWAGKQWGMIHIPRIGQEVVVDFLEGDPDQPIIVGSVYNADMMPPYTLPANKTQSGIKTRSSKTGGADNFNEIRFEDKKGSEQLYVHAEKNMDTVVENDETRDVGHDRTTTIKNDETKTVKEGNETITIKQGNQTTTIEQGDQSTTIKMGNQSLEISMGNQTVRIKMGNQNTKLDLGSSTTEAMQSIELKVGQSSVKLDQMGVTVKGMMIKIEGQIQVDVKGVITQITGSAMLTEKGGIVMIN